MRRRWLAPCAAVLALCVGSGCAATPKPVVSKAQLGQVVVYKNGVAYFERSLPPGEKELILRVPSERVDDFLKSLTIVDQATGKAVPVSYPTLTDQAGEVEMTVKLPPNHKGLRVSYVTESPAWKATYRLSLDPEGDQAKLQAWAVVDNVSGEAWRDVRIGVGSTSALSFRYDLHSVRHVAREELSAGSLLAVAPPMGSSPHLSKPGDLVAVLSQEEVSGMGGLAYGGDNADGSVVDKPIAGNVTRGAATKAGGKLTLAEPMTFGATAQHRPDANRALVDSLTDRVMASGEKLRIEGYAKNEDADRYGASLERANRLREQLLANGVPPEQVEAIGTGAVDQSQGLRVVTERQLGEGEEDRRETSKSPDAARTAPTDPGEPLGQAHFVSSRPLTIERDHSAMVSILQDDASAQRVYYYDPISPRGSERFAFNAVRFVNPSDYTLDSGPFTVYVAGQFLGEGMAEPILPHATAFIPYALDRNIVVERELDERESIESLVTIQRGIVQTEARRIRQTKLHIDNRGGEAATVYLRHQVADGYELITDGPEMPTPELLGGAQLFRIEAAAGERVTLTLEEKTPIEKTLDIRDESGIREISMFIQSADLDDDLRKSLAEVVKRHRERADLERKVDTLAEQTAVYRTRVDELNIQLVALKKLPQGAKLRRHLADKMEEISDALQRSTIELADLKAELMTRRIALEDKLAELTLTREEDRVARSQP